MSPTESLSAYRGDDKYLFVSYSHADSDRVLSELGRLSAAGFNIWYDEGISPGHNWRNELALKIEGASVFVVFITPNSIKSKNCLREVSYAVAHDVETIAIHLDQTTLPPGLELEISDRQAILAHNLSTDQYHQKLFHALNELSGTDISSRAPDSTSQPSRRDRKGLILAGVAVVAFFIFLTVYQQLTSEPGVDEATAIPVTIERPRDIEAEIDALLANDQTIDAYLLAQEFDSTHKDQLASFWDEFTVQTSIASNPEGADVWIKPYKSPESEWVSLGRTPVNQARVPKGALRLRIKKEGYQTLLIATFNPHFIFGNAFNNPRAVPFELIPGEDIGEMLVPASNAPVALGGFNPGRSGFIEIPTFQIDQYEVTNAEYIEFVADGGYENAAYWQDDVSSDEAGKQFVDQTGRAGPATWELGKFPSGHENYPVTGISWFEASAYARYRGKSLPTAFHWARAAFSLFEVALPLAPSLVPMANFSGKLAPVGKYPSLGPVGTYDLIGNAREWLYTPSGNNRWILGGSYADPSYMATLQYVEDPFDRSFVNGVRLMRYVEDSPANAELLVPSTFSTQDYTKIDPVGDAAFAALATQFSYVSTDVTGTSADFKRTEDWTREKLEVSSRYYDEPLIVYIFKPTTPGPHQPVIYFPGIGQFQGRPDEGPSDPTLLGNGGFSLDSYEFIVRSGRALIWPVYYGSYQRYDNYFQASPKERDFLSIRQMSNWRIDLGTTIDFLETRDDLASDKIAYFGFSYGVSAASPLVALEDRLTTAVFVSGGFMPREIVSQSPIVDSRNYVERIKIPVLAINGNFDYIFPLEKNAKPFFEHLGTLPEHKRHVIYQGGHSPPARNITMREIANWLDKYLGVVN